MEASMLTLYYWPGASSVIPHVTLEEIGAPYELKLINLAKGEHKGAAYLKINPRGKVPALSIDGNVLTENVAILTYLAKQFPDARPSSTANGTWAGYACPGAAADARKGGEAVLSQVSWAS